MDHTAVLREKIGHLRSEIADIQALNDRYRFVGKADIIRPRDGNQGRS